jgi:hypothetical protein
MAVLACLRGTDLHAISDLTRAKPMGYKPLLSRSGIAYLRTTAIPNILIY